MKERYPRSTAEVYLEKKLNNKLAQRKSTEEMNPNPKESPSKEEEKDSFLSY